MSCGNRTEEQVERKGDKTAIVFRDPCSGEDDRGERTEKHGLEWELMPGQGGAQRCCARTQDRFQSSRRATATGRAAARIAGGRPPMMPMNKAKITPPSSRPEVILKAKAMLLNVCQFIVAVVRPLSGSTAKQPTAPPMNDMSSASIRNENTTAAAPKPRARIVAISRPRSATAEYMVLSAPK